MFTQDYVISGLLYNASKATISHKVYMNEVKYNRNSSIWGHRSRHLL